MRASLVTWLFLLSASQALACRWPEGVSAPEHRKREILAVCERANWERRKAGLSDLVLDGRLITAAQGHAQDMAERNYFSHTSPEGWSVYERLRGVHMPFRMAGENIAWGQSRGWEVMNDWMNSDGHRSNIMNISFGRMGVGVWNYRWVQVFSDY
jgi:uncharacterized protein YkwD